MKEVIEIEKKDGVDITGMDADVIKVFENGRIIARYDRRVNEDDGTITIHNFGPEDLTEDGEYDFVPQVRASSSVIAPIVSDPGDTRCYFDPEVPVAVNDDVAPLDLVIVRGRRGAPLSL